MEEKFQNIVRWHASLCFTYITYLIPETFIIDTGDSRTTRCFTAHVFYRTRNKLI